MNGWYYPTPRSHGAGAGGGGGGGLTLECAQDIEVLGEILARGGDGGSTTMPSNNYSPAGGGAGAGGMIILRAVSEVKLGSATISTEGGAGGTGIRYGGPGGDGGDGWLLMQDGDGAIDTTGSTLVPAAPASGAFAPTTGAPSTAQTLWIDLGVFDPVFTGSNVSSVIPMLGQTVKVEVQAANEDLMDLGNPDVDTASGWTDISELTTLNGHGHRFVRLRVTFTPPEGTKREDPRPKVGSIRLSYEY